MIHLALVPLSHCGHQSLVSQTLPTPPLRQPDVIHSVLKFSKGHRCKAHPRPVFHQRELRAPLECPQPFEPVVQRSKLVPLCACLVSVHQGGGTQSRDPPLSQGALLHLGPRPEYLAFFLAPTSSSADNGGEDVPHDTILSKQRRN